MRNFPPQISAYHRVDTDIGDDEVPDTRSPRHFLWWMLGRQWSVLLASVFMSVLWQLPLMAGPWIVGKAVDQGILAGSSTHTWAWAGVLLVTVLLSAAGGITLHTWVVRSWLISLYSTTTLVTRKTVQMGHVLPRRTPTGEVLSVASSDSDEFGALTEVTVRTAGQVVTYLVVAFIVLSTSVQLGIVMLIAAPLLVMVVWPLLGPLHTRQAAERSRTSDLTSLATDIVAGLRILRGIGGERTFSSNYNEQSQRTREAGVAAGIWQAVTEAVGVLFSGIFVVLLMWLGTRAVIDGGITTGQLISLLGYALLLVQPIRTFFEFVQKLTRSLVSAHKAIAVFEQEPPWIDPEQPLSLPQLGSAAYTSPALDDDAPSAYIIDHQSGFEAEAGQLTVVVSATPEHSAELADRLGRYLHADTDPVSQELDDSAKGRAARRARAERQRERAKIIARDRELATQEWGVEIGGVDLSRVPLRQLREHVLVNDTTSTLFAGTLQDAIDPHRRLTVEAAEEAMRAASAEDVYDALLEGWQGVLDERGRGLSGGQRQRLVLARALGVQAPVLVLVEPTSAVDAHTEARIAERVADLRRGQTTVVTSVSPLWLHHADRVVLIEEGQVVATGSHDDLLSSSPAYRRVVVRSEANSDA